MNLHKLLSAVLIIALGIPAIACWFPDPITPNANRRAYKRCFYLSGVNQPGNHISGITYTNQGSNTIINYTAVNHITVNLPLTVYVGCVDINGISAGSQLEAIDMTLQYRVLPSTTWVTAVTKKFSAGDIKIMTAGKLFGSACIDCQAAQGSVILIRIYVTAQRYKQISASGTVLQTAQNIENADPTSSVVDSAQDIKAQESISFYSIVNGVNNLQVGLHLASTDLSGGTYVIYQDGWSPQFVMAVIVGSKRRPGK